MAYLVWRSPPQQFEGLVLLEKFAGVELVNRLQQLWRSGRAARRDEVG